MMSPVRIGRCAISFVLLACRPQIQHRSRRGCRSKALVIVSDYNPRSRLLPRAHELAAKLERPVHLWQLTEGEFLIPAFDRWVRMGLA